MGSFIGNLRLFVEQNIFSLLNQNSQYVCLFEVILLWISVTQIKYYY